jgi:trans-aconitate methyltransferase
MRDLIGGSGPERFDNPIGEPVYDYLPPEAYGAVFDFGCGCGRVARQLIQQQPRPQRYLGVDLHAGMVEWCRRELAPRACGRRPATWGWSSPWPCRHGCAGSTGVS